MTGLTSLCLLVLLTGCASTERIVVERDKPPAPLLAHCPEPEARLIERNSDLLLSIQDWKHALRNCNIDKEALRIWADQEPS